MAKPLIGSPRLSDAATLSTTGTVAASMPLTNLQTMQPQVKARWTSILTVNIVVDLGAAHAINLLGLVAHNGSSVAGGMEMRWRGATSEGNLTASPGYDSGTVSAWAAGGKPSGYTNTTSLHLPSSAQSFRWWRVDITDDANPDGYWQCGRLIIADAWQASRNTSLGYGLGFDDSGTVEAALGGAIWPEERGRWPVAQFRIGYGTQAEMFGDAYELDRRRGRTEDVIAILDPDATTYLHLLTLHGLFQDLSLIQNQFQQLFEKDYRIVSLTSAQETEA